MRKQTFLLLLFLVLVFSVNLLTDNWAQENNAEDEEEAQAEPAVKDTEAPVVYFQPITKAFPNEMLTLQATITDNNGLREAKLFYRAVNHNEIGPGVPFVLVDQVKNLYEAQLPVQNQNILYYIEAVDNDNNVSPRLGPYELAVSLEAAPAKEGAAAAPITRLAPAPNYFLLVLLLLLIIVLLAVLIYLFVKH